MRLTDWHRKGRKKTSEHKADALSLLLALIGGAKDVPNLVVFASTNLLNKIDDAFRRRMSGIFFVGRPNPSTRIQILRPINQDILNRKRFQFARPANNKFHRSCSEVIDDNSDY